MVDTVKVIDTTGGQLQESIVGVATAYNPNDVHGIKSVTSSIDTTLIASNKSTAVAISNSSASSTATSTSTHSSEGLNTWDGVVPFIRTRELVIKAYGMMGKRIHYPYMENTDITQYCVSFTRLYITTNQLFAINSNADIKDGSDVVVATVKVIAVTKFYTETVMYCEKLTGTITVGNTISQADKTGSITDLVNGVASPVLTTDKFGGLMFKYTIPPGVFSTGTRRVRLVDIHDAFKAPERSSANGEYSANGTIHFQQTVITNTIVTNIVTTVTNTTNKVTTNNITNTLNKVQATNIHYNDPLAQTFVINDQTNPSGIFISSVDLYFKRVPTDAIPLTIQIRNVRNGTPVAFEYLFNGQKRIYPSDIVTSEDGMTPTNIKFINPVYLVPGEYAIVLISSSDEYEVYIAEQGKKQIGTNIVISESPSLGVLLKSANASTWTAMQESDLTFRLHRAVFVGSGNVSFDVVQTTIAFTGNISNGTPYITNVVLSDQYKDIFDLYIDYIISGTGIPSGAKVIEIDLDLNRLKLDQNATASTTGLSLQCHPVIDYSLLSFNIGLETPPGTETQWSYRTLSESTNQQTEYPEQSLGTVRDFKSTQRIIDPIYNSGRVPLRITGTLTSSDNKLSPILNTASAYAKASRNIINNDSDYETTPIGGHADSVYFTKRIPLGDGFDASNMMVLFDCNRPAACSVKVYLKVSALDSTDAFHNNPWQEMIPSNSPQASIDDFDFREYKYIPQGSIDAYGVPIDDPISPRFNMYAIKIVMLSSDKAFTPRIKNLRGIALDN
jgi:hypothetical protein